MIHVQFGNANVIIEHKDSNLDGISAFYDTVSVHISCSCHLKMKANAHLMHK